MGWLYRILRPWRNRRVRRTGKCLETVLAAALDESLSPRLSSETRLGLGGMRLYLAIKTDSLQNWRTSGGLRSLLTDLSNTLARNTWRPSGPDFWTWQTGSSATGTAAAYRNGRTGSGQTRLPEY